MGKTEYISKSYNELKNIKIPSFQRGLVWSSSQKNDFIQTLKNNYPFGSLLLATIGNNEDFKLLDGQQRLATIKEYDKDKLKFWKPLNIDSYHNEINKLDDLYKSQEDKRGSITETEFDIILNMSTKTGDIGLWLSKHFNQSIFEEASKIVYTLKREIEEYINLSVLTIPVIRFQGENSSELAEAFAGLNKGGVPLTKYEIYSATWVDKKIKMPNDNELADSILDYVKKFYTNLQDNSEFELNNFSEDEITNSRKINLAEFGRALGEFVVDKIPSLMAGKQNDSDKIGFGILGIATSTENSNIASLGSDENAKAIQEIVPKILIKADTISERLNRIFDGLLKQKVLYSKNKQRIEYSTGLYSTFKILSYFASLWDSSDEEQKLQLKNIRQYYLLDYLNSSWSGHGDQRLTDYYPEHSRNYNKRVEKEELDRAFNTWLEENIGIKKNFSKEIKAIITIHSNLMDYGKDFIAESTEFEHIIPKQKMLDVDNKPSHLAISSLGNGMFLPHSLNDSKQTLTIYEYKDKEKENKKLDFTDDFISNSRYPTRDDFKQINGWLKNKEFDKVNKFIKKRAKKLTNDIVNKLCDKSLSFEKN